MIILVQLYILIRYTGFFFFFVKHCQIEGNIGIKCPDPEYAEKLIAAINAVRVRGFYWWCMLSCA